jgi:hypothetical protein
MATKTATKVSTAWGSATVVEEVTLQQKAGDKRFASIVQLLEGERGETLVRFAYTTGDAARRGPVTLRASDLDRLRKQLSSRPALAQALGIGEVDA